MPEKINIVADTPPSMLLMHAISLEGKDIAEQVAAASSDCPTVEVQLLVAGIEAPFSAIVDRMWSEALRIARGDLHEKAFAMVSEAGLGGIEQAIRDVKWDLLKKFKEAGIELELSED
jgi:hypothetical protein